MASGHLASNLDQHISSSYVEESEGDIYNCVAIIIRCPEHKKIGLQQLSGKNVLWFPVVKIGEIDRPSTVIKNLLVHSLKAKNGQTVHFSPPRKLQTCRFQITKQGTYFELEIYTTEIERKNNTCCNNLHKLQWFTKLSVDEPNVWGPEPAIFHDVLSEATPNTPLSNLINPLLEFSVRNASSIVPHGPPKTLFDSLLISAKYDEKTVEGIYSEFIEHCFPSRAMNLVSFCDYLSRVGWGSGESDMKKLARTYYAFKVPGTRYIRVNEFVFGLAAFDRKTDHGGTVAPLRCGYIFRFYDEDNDDLLGPGDMFKMRQDIMLGQSGNREIPKDEVFNALFHDYEDANLNQREPLTQKRLIDTVTARKFRGTATLCRSPVEVLSHRLYTPTLKPSAGPLCEGCLPLHAVVAQHEITLNAYGHFTESNELGHTDSSEKHSVGQKIASIEVFDNNSVVNVMLKWIRELFSKFQPENNRHGVPARDFYAKESPDLIQKVVLEVLAKAKNTFIREPRMHHVNSPCYLMGDIHGNLYDLLCYETMLWRHAPVADGASYVFLGDYVDRGDHGVECVLYLFCMKLLSPNKFFLLRGNHETRALQKNFSFQAECMKKFHNDESVWEAFNKTFDCLPICAVIDDAIFCAHGGIPATVNDLSQISIPRPMSDPEIACPSAWEMLWNDPISANEYVDFSEMMRLQSGAHGVSKLAGFMPNNKRGTAYYFSPDALEQFLKKNGLSHVVRAHEVMPDGFAFHHQGRTITVFSSSKYCSGTNEASCVFISDQKIRPIKLNTHLLMADKS